MPLEAKGHDDYGVVVATGQLLGGEVNGGSLPAATRAGHRPAPTYAAQRGGAWGLCGSRLRGGRLRGCQRELLRG